MKRVRGWLSSSGAPRSAIGPGVPAGQDIAGLGRDSWAFSLRRFSIRRQRQGVEYQPEKRGKYSNAYSKIKSPCHVLIDSRRDVLSPLRQRMGCPLHRGTFATSICSDAVCNVYVNLMCLPDTVDPRIKP
jgi:hypothetical protein